MWRVSLLAAVLAAGALAQELPKGQIIPEVQCAAAASETYTLYVPSNYSKERKWSLLIAFDPRARGRAPVELYQAAAEKYGYIVAGSNTSKNGPVGPSMKAAQAMMADLGARFSIDDRRMYVTGLSGGSRFAMDLAIGTQKFAGVIASSAGFAHPSEGEETLSFALFATAGTEDFNYLEMRQLDRQVTSPHRLRIFAGEHGWPTGDAAMEAVEWMELQAMKSGRRAKDEGFIDRTFAARKAEVAALTAPGDVYYATRALAADFRSLRDVSAYSARAATLGKDREVGNALTATMLAEINEAQMNAEILNYSDQLGNPLEHADCLAALRERLTKLSSQAKAPEDSPDRRMARRVLKGVLADNTSHQDADYRKLLDEVRP